MLQQIRALSVSEATGATEPYRRRGVHSHAVHLKQALSARGFKNTLRIRSEYAI
jgi:hypothetical protein